MADLHGNNQMEQNPNYKQGMWDDNQKSNLDHEERCSVEIDSLRGPRKESSVDSPEAGSSPCEEAKFDPEAMD